VVGAAEPADLQLIERKRPAESFWQTGTHARFEALQRIPPLAQAHA
jgi:hypothetical protein